MNMPAHTTTAATDATDDALGLESTGALLSRLGRLFTAEPGALDARELACGHALIGSLMGSLKGLRGALSDELRARVERGELTREPGARTIDVPGIRLECDRAPERDPVDPAALTALLTRRGLGALAGQLVRTDRRRVNAARLGALIERLGIAEDEVYDVKSRKVDEELLSVTLLTTGAFTAEEVDALRVPCPGAPRIVSALSRPDQARLDALVGAPTGE
jgi:hypothetical protein